MIQTKCRRAMRVTGKLNTPTYLSAILTNAATTALLALERSSCGKANKSICQRTPRSAAAHRLSHASSSLPKNQDCAFKSLHFIMIP